jgi:hypothetical protein
MEIDMEHDLLDILHHLRVAQERYAQAKVARKLAPRGREKTRLAALEFEALKERYFAEDRADKALRAHGKKVD